jgi:SAM-dependent methyltransferase
MADDEYAVTADDLQDRLRALPRRDAIAVASRGSGDPASLAWIAEALELGTDQLVLDIGGGTGGPAAWLHDRYGCQVVVADPVEEAARVATDVFGVPAVVADGAGAPFAGPAHAVVALAVLSVSDDRLGLLAEARRLAPRLGLLVWCAAGDEPVEVADSTFLPLDGVLALLAEAGWDVVAGPESPSLPAPPSWQRNDDDADTDEEDAVGRVIDEGAVGPHVLVCHAADGADRPAGDGR